jgi:hypothetical protein
MSDYAIAYSEKNDLIQLEVVCACSLYIRISIPASTPHVNHNLNMYIHNCIFSIPVITTILDSIAWLL